MFQKNTENFFFPLGQSSFSFVMSTGNKSLDGNQEFQIQNEDFPALPGATQQQMQSDGSALGGGLQGITQSTSSTTTHTIQHQDSKESLATEPYGSHILSNDFDIQSLIKF